MFYIDFFIIPFILILMGTMKKKDFVSRKLTEQDRKILESYAVVADGVGRIFGNCCETTIHSLENPFKSLIYINHGEVTGRQIGSPLTDLALELIEKSKHTTEDVIGPYFSRTSSGRQLRSVTILIRNENKDLIGFICINLDISAPLDQFMKIFMPVEKNDGGEPVSENYSNTVADLVRSAFLNVQKKISQTTGVAPIEKNKKIIQKLQELGIFDIKGAVDTVAAELGVSKFTIYNYLRDVKDHTEEM
jgi:predicted transcriptional regulator YheO